MPIPMPSEPQEPRRTGRWSPGNVGLGFKSPSALHSVSDCRAACGHNHSDFISIIDCAANCQHSHSDFTSIANCRAACGHSHSDFASIDNCKLSCHHDHASFADPTACRQTCGHSSRDFPRIPNPGVVGFYEFLLGCEFTPLTPQNAVSPYRCSVATYGNRIAIELKSGTPQQVVWDGSNMDPRLQQGWYQLF